MWPYGNVAPVCKYAQLKSFAITPWNLKSSLSLNYESIHTLQGLNDGISKNETER